MKLSAFRIKNFRSIVDSGWHNLASDNITGLIGQNESGKTAVLEALKCFYDGEISEDVQRRGAGLPEVYCSFHIGSKKLKSLFDEQLLPEGLLDKVTEIGNRINLKRNWTNLNESNIFLEEEALIDIFQSHAKKLLDKEAENDEKIKKELKLESSYCFSLTARET